jgi:flagellar biogenesis protein FliO
MTNEFPMTNDKCRMEARRAKHHSSFGFRHSLVFRISLFVICPLAILLSADVPADAQTNSTAATFNPALPSSDMGVSLLRVMGALALVLGIFLAGVWLFRNWQRLAVKGGRTPKLNVLEIRSLGGRQSIYVVGYEQERFLLASSPAGVNFLTHLPSAGNEEASAAETKPPMPFSQALAQVLKGK